MRIALPLVILLILPSLLFGFLPTNEDFIGGEAPVEHLTTVAPDNLAWANFTSRYPGWLGFWDEETQSLRRAYGNGIQLGNVSSDEELDHSIREFVRKNSSALRIAPECLELLSVNRVLGKIFAIYRETYRGIPVWLGRLDFDLSNDGKLVLISLQTHPNLSVDINPGISEDELADYLPKWEEISSAEPVIFPEDRGHLAWWVRTGSKRSYILDAHTGEILLTYRETPTCYGEVTGNIHPEYMTDTPMVLPLPFVYINLDSEMDTADVNGRYSNELSPGWVWVQAKGLFCDVQPFEAEPIAVIDEVTGDEVNLFWEDVSDESGAYLHINLIHNYYKMLDADFCALDYEVPVVVRDEEPPCPDNAFWDGYGVHLGAGGDIFNNFAFFSDVIYHEYTHGVTHNIYPSSELPYTGQPGAIDEALSDYFACTMTDDPLIGEGGLYRIGDPGIYMRSLDNDLVFPDDWEGEVHADSRMISSAFWEIRESLGAGYTDTLVHFARYGYPNRFDDYAYTILVLDDDDGDLSNGSPHFSQIYSAFQRHGIGHFDIVIVHTGYHDTEDDINPYPITAEITSTFPLDMDTTGIYFSTGEEYSFIPITEVEPHIYIGYIPAQPYGTIVSYYIFAKDTMNVEASLPEGAPEELFSFRVGEDTIPPVIRHTPPDGETPETFPVEIKSTATDNLGLETVILEYHKNHEADRTIPMTEEGIDTYSVPIDFDDIAVGDTVYYRITATDASSHHNEASFPEEGYASFPVVRGIFLDFEETDGMFVSSDGWEWGEPHGVGPEEAYSGRNLWGTIIDGYYANDADYSLTTPDFDISDFSVATVEMYQWFSTEERFDGGNIKVSTDGGESWNILIPIGGYNTHEVSALSEPGFSGSAPDWKKVKYNLSSYLGGNVRFRFDFRSDHGMTDAGWYFDDFVIMEKQLLLAPVNLLAESGWEDEIPLHWSPPEPGMTPGEGFIGYNVYRSEEPDIFPPEPINPAPTTDSFYTDYSVIPEREYFYYVTAVYVTGESPPSEIVSASSYWVVMETTSDSVAVRLLLRGTAEERFDIVNSGTGPLRYSVAVAPYSSKSTFLEPPGEWTLLADDPIDTDLDLDLAAFFAQHTEAMLYFMITAHRPMGDYTSDYIIGYGLDTDCNPATGFAMGSVGADYIIGQGALGYGTSMILRYNPDSPYGFDMVGPAEWEYSNDSGDTVAIGVSITDIGTPTETNLVVATMPEVAFPPPIEDFIPDEGCVHYSVFSVDWLSFDPVSGEIPTGGRSAITLLFNAGSHPPGDYLTNLVIRSNDRVNPEIAIPVYMEVVVGIDAEETLPARFAISQPYPNPFNSKTDIRFDVPQESTVDIHLFNIKGEIVETVLSDKLAPGRYRIAIDMKKLPSGVYFIRMRAGKFCDAKKLILLK